MSKQYSLKYNLVMTPSAWGNYRRRHGLERRIVRNDNLLPWEVREVHRWSFAARMLRVVARLRAGRDVNELDRDRLKTFNERLEADDLVVHYDADTDEGWFYVPRRPGIDNDMIREPEHKTTKRPAAD